MRNEESRQQMNRLSLQRVSRGKNARVGRKPVIFILRMFDI